MAEGNGIDLGSIYGLLVEVAKTVSRHDAALLSLQDDIRQLRSDTHGIRAEMHGIRSELKAEIAALRSETRAEFATLRQTVTQYHSSVLGHGILISDLEERVRRIENHLDLPAHVSG